MMHFGTETGSLINHLSSRIVGAVPEVGMGATVLLWSDRKAGTVIAVYRDKAGEISGYDVQQDKATRTDDRSVFGNQEYAYAPDPEGRVFEIRRVVRGKAKGQFREDGRKDGHCVRLGVRDEFYDYSF